MPSLINLYCLLLERRKEGDVNNIHEAISVRRRKVHIYHFNIISLRWVFHVAFCRTMRLDKHAIFPNSSLQHNLRCARATDTRFSESSHWQWYANSIVNCIADEIYGSCRSDRGRLSAERSVCASALRHVNVIRGVISLRSGLNGLGSRSDRLLSSRVFTDEIQCPVYSGVGDLLCYNLLSELIKSSGKFSTKRSAY